MTENREILLKVEHLEQYFKLGKFAVNKAVDLVRDSAVITETKA